MIASLRAQTYEPLHGADLLLTPTAGPHDTAVTVTGGGCTPGATVTISFREQVLGVVRVGQAGEFSTTAIIPPSAKSGAGPVSAVGPGCRLSAAFAVQAATGTATASAATASGRSTPGAYGLSEAVAGLGVFGAVLVFAVRRRRHINR